MSAIQTLSRANDPSWRPRSAPFAMPDRILAAPRGPGDSRRGQRSAFTIPESSAVPGGSSRRRTSFLAFPGTSWRHRERRRWRIPGETIADRGLRLSKGRPGRRPLGGPGGGRWAAGREAGASGGSLWESGIFPPGDGFSPPRGLRGGDHASCAKWLETEPKASFSRGSRPGPPAGIPAPLRHLNWLRRGRSRVLRGAAP